MRHFVIVLLCGLLSPSVMMGQQSTNEQPDWVKGYFYDRQNSNSYIEVVSATDYIEEDALKKAEQLAKERRSSATGQRVIIGYQNRNTSIVGTDELTVKQRVIDTYSERLESGEYRVYLLVQTAKNPQLPIESAIVSNKYGFSPRVFVPGMAQIHKGQTTRGTLFIVGEVTAIGGIIAFEGLRSSYNSKIGKTHNTSERQNYINKVDNMSNIRNGFIAGAVAIYAWNIIDGIVAKGKKHVIVGNTNMAFTPYIDPTSQGLLLSVTF